MDSSRRRIGSLKHRRPLPPPNPALVPSHLARITQPLDRISKPVRSIAKSFHPLPPIPRIYHPTPFLPCPPPFRPADPHPRKRDLSLIHLLCDPLLQSLHTVHSNRSSTLIHPQVSHLAQRRSPSPLKLRHLSHPAQSRSLNPSPQHPPIKQSMKIKSTSLMTSLRRMRLQAMWVMVSQSMSCWTK